jgi:hypothetical protein
VNFMFSDHNPVNMKFKLKNWFFICKIKINNFS